MAACAVARQTVVDGGSFALPIAAKPIAECGQSRYSSAAGGSVCVYDVASAYQPMHIVTAESFLGAKHTLRLCASPDGRFVVATSADGPCDGAVFDARRRGRMLQM